MLIVLAERQKTGSDIIKMGAGMFAPVAALNACLVWHEVSTEKGRTEKVTSGMVSAKRVGFDSVPEQFLVNGSTLRNSDFGVPSLLLEMRVTANHRFLHRPRLQLGRTINSVG